MLYNNQGAAKKAIAEALATVSLYRHVGDDRGLARALSQVANQYAREQELGEAKSAAEDALRLARERGDRRLLADVLRRCAGSFSTDGVERVREMYAESVAIFRSLGRDDETARALTWLGLFEAEVGNYDEAAKRLIEAKPFADDELVASVAGEVAACYLATGDRTNAQPAAREALALAVKFRQPIEMLFAISYVAASGAQRDVREAAVLIGYAEERLRDAGWQRLNYDLAIVEGLQDVLKQRLADAELSRLFAAGAAMGEEEAVARATALTSLS
jgi:tetratricopeptide (TPR) repeat protein